MRASRTDTNRQIQFHADNLSFDGAAALRRQIIKRIEKLQNPPSTRDLERWFYATDSGFLSDQLYDLMARGRIRCFSKTMGRRRHNSVVYYELSEK